MARGCDGGYAVRRSRRGRDAAPATCSGCRQGGVVLWSRFMAEVAVAVGVLVGDGLTCGVRDVVGGSVEEERFPRKG